jgi:hypothetical protein
MKVYQIHITLTRFEPTIWRRASIPADVSLADFHIVIQILMGWDNEHLFQFGKGKTIYSADDEEFEYIKLSDLLKRQNEKVIYEYDFGDSWKHEIILEKIFDNEVLKFPICLGGEMSCPPEDCGGVWGYSDLLEVLKSPEHEDYEDIIEWMGGEFDPGHFDIDEVNTILKRFEITEGKKQNKA